ncbi:MAG: ribosome maturation factor RimP [Actinobacteria bacterium]|jgi:ribosome maturation factor RimP|nr:ribosome maturation factor RimP [Actinomycetota bacterium]NDA94660.1 ribosome maturation factor RimP [Actinomycetota bacterium]NDI08151.1 ribosome maturation factor RimP [Actinomycetota bacterium]
MSLSDKITELVQPAVESAGFFLEDVHVVSPGNHRIVTCIVDGHTPLNLDQVTSVSRDISELLDAADFMDDTAFTLEVTSPGVDRPLTLGRHWKKNINRLVKVVKHDGSVINGRITSVEESHALLSEDIKGKLTEHTVVFADIQRATVEIEFNRKGDL